MFGALGKLANQAGNALKGIVERVVNEEELEAVIAAAVLMAAADGKIDDVEKEAAFKAISIHESLTAFPKDKVKRVFDEYAGLVSADATLATEVLIEKVSVIKDKIARIKVLGIAQQIANADGEFSDAEKKMVDKIRRATA